MDKTNIDAFFTIQSLLTLQGSTAATLLVPNVLGYLVGKSLDKYRKYISFIISMFLAYLIAIIASTEPWYKWILAFLNGFVIFASAVGINEISSKPPAVGKEKVEEKLFFIKWFQ